MAHRISTYSPLHVDEINEPNNTKRKAEKKLREIENLKKLSAHTPEQRNKLAREQEWRDILNPPPPPPTFHEPPKQTNKQRKKEKEREAKKKRAEEIRIQKEAREQEEKEAREKYQREYKTRQEEFHRKWREQEERKQKERDDLQRKEDQAKQKRDAALGKYKNDPLAINLYNAFNTPLAIHLLTEYGEVNNKSDNRNAYIRLSRKYHPDKTGGTTTEQQKIIGFIRDYLQDKILSNLS